MFNTGSPLAALLSAPMRPGTVAWIGLRPARRETLISMGSASLDPVQGLAGDHYRGRTGGSRQVTLIQAEQLDAIASHLGRNDVAPDEMRRNIVTRGVNLLALKGACFSLGTALLEMTGECHPCSRMEDVLGPGGYNAVRGHGGITARIVAAGEVRLGDGVRRLDAAKPE